MLVSDFDFNLPGDLIAQQPAPERGSSRLLHLDRSTGRLAHRTVADLPELLEGALLVVNNTRVFPARLIGRRVPSGGAVECLLIHRVSTARLRGDHKIAHPRLAAGPAGVCSTDAAESVTDPAGGELWEALVHPGQRLGPGQRIQFDGVPTLHAEILERLFHGRRLVRLWTGDGSPIDLAVDAIGHMPLPPYIKRADGSADRERYQTVFARERGSVAAPTAGLHLNRALLAALAAHGVTVVEITLHVGYGTFQPVRVEQVEDHRLEPERYDIGAVAAAAVNRALDENQRVVAVGTTTTRTLEAVARANGGRLVAGSGATDLFIHPGFAFRVVGGLVTNFHLPRSSLLILVAAFAGRDRLMHAYAAAIAERYRFYSYGDAMLII